jgi:hypothetical protein
VRLAVFTAVYPAARPWLGEFVASLAGQEDRDFALVAAADGGGFAAAEFPGIPRLHLVPVAGDPVMVRTAGIRAASELGFDALVFADADDVQGRTRVSEARRRLESVPVLANEMVAFGEGGEDRPLLGGRLAEGAPIVAADLLEGNCLGLGNTAARVADLLPHLGMLRAGLPAPDWALFYRVLRAGATARFTARAVTRYRQHGANAAGAWRGGADQVTAALAVKAAHYAALADDFPEFARRAARYAAAAARSASDPAGAARLLAPRPAPPAFWWEGATLADTEAA